MSDVATLMTSRPATLTEVAGHFHSVNQVVAVQPQLQEPVKARLAGQRGAVVDNTLSVLKGQAQAQESLGEVTRSLAQRTTMLASGMTQCQQATARILNAARAHGLGVAGNGTVIAFDPRHAALAAQYNSLLKSACSAAQTFDRSVAADIRNEQQKLTQTLKLRVPSTLLNPAGFTGIPGKPAEQKESAFSATAEPTTGFEAQGPANPQAPQSATLNAKTGDTTFHVDLDRQTVTGGGITQTFRDSTGKPSGELGVGYTPDAVSVDYSGAGKNFYTGGTYHLDTHQIDAKVGGNVGGVNVEGSAKYNVDTSTVNSLGLKVGGNVGDVNIEGSAQYNLDTSTVDSVRVDAKISF